MFRKRSLKLFIMILLIGGCCSFLFGCSEEKSSIVVPTPKEDVFVYDEDDLFSDSEEEQLNGYLQELEDKTDAEFVVLTIKSLGGNSIEDYSIEVANGLGIGKSDADNGVLLIMSRSDERVRLEIGKGLEGILNDSKCGRILDDYFVPYREDDDYVTATNETVKAVITVIADDAGVTIDGIDSTDSTVSEESDSISLTNIIALIVVIVFIFFMIILIIDDDYYGGYGGGYGGGGFHSSGGFGGGSFGGGGASR